MTKWDTLMCDPPIWLGLLTQERFHDFGIDLENEIMEPHARPMLHPIQIVRLFQNYFNV